MLPAPAVSGANQFYCNLCNILININDKNNHIDGNKHKYKLRQNETKNKNEGNIECKICKVELTSDDFYKIHIGSKKHKRNCRNHRLKKLIKEHKNNKSIDQENSSIEPDTSVRPFLKQIGRRAVSVPTDEYVQPNYYSSSKEKYRSNGAKNTEEIYQNYLNSLLAYWGVILAMHPMVKDFKISVNNKEWGTFGNVVLEIDYCPNTDSENSVRNIYAINLKYISNNTKQLDDINKGKFNLSKLIANAICAPLPKNDEIIKYIIFTTADPSSQFRPKLRIKGELFHTKHHCDNKIDYIDIGGKTLNKNNMVNTVDDKDNVFRLFSTDISHPLPKVYLYAGQKKLKRFGPGIDAALSKRFGLDQLEVSAKIINFIQYWNEDLLGGTYKLNKEDILVKIGDILLSPYKAELQIGSAEANQDFKAWNQAMNAVDITILHKHPFIINSICKPINAYIEQNHKFIINPNNKQVTIPQEQLKSLNKALAMYVFEETIDYTDYSHVPLFSIYRAFWKAGLAPLILESEEDSEREYILQIITVLKELGLLRKYIIKLPNPKYEHIVKILKYLTYFLSLDDIINKLPPATLNTLKIGVSEKFHLNLKTIQTNDKYFFRNITANDFFDIALGKYNLKQCHDIMDKDSEWKLVLNDKLIKQIKTELEPEEQTDQNSQKKNYLCGLDPAIF
ncbi:uncharacterized protein LOC143191011 [Rhynchophorus ferrugineus]|uniref:uncharacterized protein LOC143191011 n=1 Tax=Rhynchophorus ferrugineus TaxID=354439 RepID=UPI003FCCCC44